MLIGAVGSRQTWPKANEIRQSPRCSSLIGMEQTILTGEMPGGISASIASNCFIPITNRGNIARAAAMRLLRRGLQKIWSNSFVWQGCREVSLCRPLVAVPPGSAGYAKVPLRARALNTAPSIRERGFWQVSREARVSRPMCSVSTVGSHSGGARQFSVDSAHMPAISLLGERFVPAWLLPA